MNRSPLAIVTGGSRGIGRDIVDALLKDGDVLNISRSPVGVPLHTGHGTLFNLNVDLADVETAVAELEIWFAGHPFHVVTLFISNAATLELGRLHASETLLRRFESVFQINAQAPLALTTSVFRLGRFCETDARILYTTSSLARQVPELSFAGIGLYSASKAALSRLAMVQAREFALTAPQISIVLVHPGIVDTEMQRELRANPDLDPAFVEKTASLPAYRDGEWRTQDPKTAMRTIPPNFAAEFLVWITKRERTTLRDYYDFYDSPDFHQRDAH